MARSRGPGLMTFNSLHFAVFFLAVLGLYPVLGHRAQNRFLLVASCYFYGVWDWRYLLLLLAATLLDFFCGLAIHAHVGTPRAKFFLTLSMVGNLTMLGFFKYYNFFVDSLIVLLGAVGLDASPLVLGVVLPVGISFYTFQTMSYTIDIYRGELVPTRSFVDFALFVTFFPQLVAGPIERAVDLLPQVVAERSVTREKVASGLHLMAFGLFKKVVIADNLAKLVVDPLFDPGLGFTGTYILLAAYGFAFQIYCDFSGYSDLARGAARCLGFELSKNFDHPYLAQNPREFWSGWHISLSTWLRDYLYIPLGGNRSGKTHRNLLYTMLLGGLWHGAEWKFVLWGAYHGALLVAHRIWSLHAGPRSPSSLARLLRVVGMFHLTCLGWLIFRARDVRQIGRMLHGLFTEYYVFDFELAYVSKLAFFAGPLLFVHILQRRLGRVDLLSGTPWPFRACSYAVLFYAFILFGQAGGAEFIYFQF